MLAHAMKHFKWIAVYAEARVPASGACDEVKELYDALPKTIWLKRYVLDGEERAAVEKEHPAALFFDTMEAAGRYAAEQEQKDDAAGTPLP